MNLKYTNHELYVPNIIELDSSQCWTMNYEYKHLVFLMVLFLPQRQTNRNSHSLFEDIPALKGYMFLRLTCYLFCHLGLFEILHNSTLACTGSCNQMKFVDHLQFFSIKMKYPRKKLFQIWVHMNSISTSQLVHTTHICHVYIFYWLDILTIVF